jgi:ABC-type uncharacterized transport system ATPase subunit
MGTVPMVEMVKITKKFPGVIANDQVSFAVNLVKSMLCSERTALEKVL